VAAGVLVIHENINFGLARAWSELPAAADPAAEPRFPVFPLTDRPRRFDTLAWDGKRPFPQDGFTLADPDEEVSARHLCRRLVALKRALDDIPGHAKRLGRLEARRKAGLPHARRHAPLRPGWPPGVRKRPVREIDDILRECHSLAHYALKPPDTS
jgi:hypothetical protein